MAKLTDGTTTNGGPIPKDERRRLAKRAFDMSIRGYSYREIAEELEMSRVTVSKMVNEMVEETKPPDYEMADTYREESVEQHGLVIRMCLARMKAAGKMLADGTIVPVLSPHGMQALLMTLQVSRREIDRLRGVAPPDQVQITGKLSIAEFSKEKADLPRERRLRVVDAEAS